MTDEQSPGSGSDMCYGLMRLVLESSSVLPVSEVRYGAIEHAKSFLAEVVALEQKFDLVVSNLLELEQTLNAMAADSMIRNDFDHGSMLDAVLLVNQRVHNVLSACRGYLDQGSRHVENLRGLQPDLVVPFRDATAKQYDASAHYRLADSLRNYAQHQGFAIRSIQLGGERVELPQGGSILRHSVQAFVDVTAMLEAGNTKRIVSEWLEACQFEIDARIVLRDYVAALALVHEGVRTATEPDAVRMERLLQECISDYSAAFPAEQSVVGLAAVRLNQDGSYDKPLAIFREALERRTRFVMRNANLQHLAGWHVSSEPRSRTPRRVRR